MDLVNLTTACETRLVNRLMERLAPLFTVRAPAPGTEPLTVKQAADFFCCSNATLYRLVARRDLHPMRPMKPYLFTPAELCRYQQSILKK